MEQEKKQEEKKDAAQLHLEAALNFLKDSEKLKQEVDVKTTNSLADIEKPTTESYSLDE
jgi:hypothetical protein